MPVNHPTPANKGQVALVKALRNDKPITFITGRAGTGKNLITISEGIQAVFGSKRFGKNGNIVYTRIQEQMGMELGFFAGDLYEGKTAPFMKPFFKSLKTMNALVYAQEVGKRIFLEPIQTMRGDTHESTFFIVDEAQNVDCHTLAGIATRPDLNSKIIIMGNFAQTDNAKLRRPENNGFYTLLQGMYDGGYHKEFDHIHLTEIKRNPISQIIESILVPDHTIDPRMIALEERGIVE